MFMMKFFSMQFNVVIYNPIGRVVSHDVRVPLSTNQVLVYDEEGKRVPAQVMCVCVFVHVCLCEHACV